MGESDCNSVPYAGRSNSLGTHEIIRAFGNISVKTTVYFVCCAPSILWQPIISHALNLSRENLSIRIQYMNSAVSRKDLFKGTLSPEMCAR
jgi:hypothetical protein